MNRRILPVAGAVVVTLALGACAAEKSSNPLSPTVAGPIPGVTISAPSSVQPVSGSKFPVDQQPVTLIVANATTSGVRPLTYRFEIATDTNFSTMVFTRNAIAPGEGSRTSLRLPESLAPERAYYWRARAEDGANTGPFSTSAEFNIFTPVVFQAPGPIAPINNAVASSLRPRFSFANAQRTGVPGAVSYLIELSDSSAFAMNITATVAEQSGQTSLDLSQDLPANRQFFWHVRAFEPTTTGPWSATQVFRTPAGGGGGIGPPVNWTNEQWHDYFFSLIAQKGVGSYVTYGALVTLRPDLNALGAEWQHDSGGTLRPRLFLPTGNPGDPYGRAVDVGDWNGPWQWLPR